MPASGEGKPADARVSGIRDAFDVAEPLKLARGLGDRLRADAEVLGHLADGSRALDELLEDEAVRVTDGGVFGAQPLEDLGVEDLAEELGPEHKIVVM